MCCKYLCIFSVFIYALCMRQYFCAIVLNLRFKIDVVVMIIWSIVNIIISVLTLQVSTASSPHDREPCEIKVVSNHTCSLHTCVCAGSRRVRVCLRGFQWQGISSTPGGFLKCPIPVRVCAEHEETVFLRTLSIRLTNFRLCSASEIFFTVFTCTAMLSIWGNDFIAPWAYEKMI